MRRLHFFINEDGNISVFRRWSSHCFEIGKETKAAFYRKFVESLPLLMRHYKEIVTIPRYYFSPALNSYVDSAFVGRRRKELVIGELLELWLNNKWKAVCPRCGGSVYITNIAGSPLSGRGSAWGYCVDCSEIVGGIKPFNRFFREVMELPVRDISKGIFPVSLETLISELFHMISYN